MKINEALRGDVKLSVDELIKKVKDIIQEKEKDHNVITSIYSFCSYDDYGQENFKLSIVKDNKVDKRNTKDFTKKLENLLRGEYNDTLLYNFKITKESFYKIEETNAK